MAVHLKELAGIALKETFKRNVDLKGKWLLKVMRGGMSDCSEDVKEMVLLPLS